MRINEYNSLDEFKNEFVGEWSPTNGHWYGLDFSYKNEEYRLNTGSMYNEENTILEDGSIALFGVYHKNKDINNKNRDYILVGEYSDIESLLDLCYIDGKKFREVIMDDSTRILGKD